MTTLLSSSNEVGRDINFRESICALAFQTHLFSPQGLLFIRRQREIVLGRLSKKERHIVLESVRRGCLLGSPALELIQHGA